MLITSVMLATKFFDDETFNNLYYAKVGGLQVTELNCLEEKFLSLINFSLTIQADIFERYHCELAKHTVGCTPKSSISAPTTKAFPEINAITESVRPACPKPAPKVASCAPRPLRSSAPAIAQAPSLVRSVCEALVCETTKDKTLQSRLTSRVSELLGEEERFHHKLPPSTIKGVCSKLVSENGLSPSLITRASAQAERLERLEKMENVWYSSYDYAGRDSITSPPPSTKYNMECANTLKFGNMSLNNQGVAFSQCSPSYSNNSRHMITATWG